MRQHVNPFSKNFDEVERIPTMAEMFNDFKLPLHLDIGSASGDFLFELALDNCNWNYLGIEIRERLARNAQSKVLERGIENLYFAFGNAYKIFNDPNSQFILKNVKSISFNFPDPWFKKRHFKRRVIQPEFIDLLSKSMQKGSLIFIKTDVKNLFDHMDCTILSNLQFKKVDKKIFNYTDSFNPNKYTTNREKYVIVNELDIFESIYMKN